MKKKALAYYLDLMKSAQDKEEWAKSKRYGEIAVKKIQTLSYSPFEEYLLYIRLGTAYTKLAEYTQSLVNAHKAYMIASKKHLGESYIEHSSYLMGCNFFNMLNINQALLQFQKVEKYYQKYGYETWPMNKERYFNNLVRLGYCYLLKGNISKAEEIIEKQLSQCLLSNPTDYNLQNYYNLKGEYLVELKKYDQARQSFEECIKINRFSSIIYTARANMAIIELLEGRLQSGIQSLELLLKDIERENLFDYICATNILLGKCFSLKGMPDKARLIEKRIKPYLNKVDINWFYETSREFEQLYKELQSIYSGYSSELYSVGQIASFPLPQIITDTLKKHYAPITHQIIGQSILMQEIYHLIDKIAPTDLPVLIQGETGTGKELVAWSMHNNSAGSGKTWLALNCGVVTETLLESELFGHTKGAFTDAKEDRKGYIELASEGTLFLDEIAEMSPAMQQKLLRVLEEKLVWRVGASKPIPINTRFIFASNQNIEELVKAKKFREDLYYRINTIVISLPPLRDRKEDIPLLINHFLSKYSLSNRPSSIVSNLSSEALKLLVDYSWPGNVRELENEIKRICALYPNNKEITQIMLSEPIKNYGASIIAAPSSLKEIKKQASDAIERRIITGELKKTRGNITQTARLLGCRRSSLQRKIKQLKIDIPIEFVTKK